MHVIRIDAVVFTEEDPNEWVRKFIERLKAEGCRMVGDIRVMQEQTA